MTEQIVAADRFTVRLENFTGPFDLLLNLISKHELDITEVALAVVTDEFVQYIRRLQASGQDWALDEASEFLVVAATLLDLKAARLLPAGEVENEEDIALLEARDLLFARLLQYRAFKEVARLIGDRLTAESSRHPRLVALEPQFAALLPELILKTTPEDFAALAAKAFAPKPATPTEVGLTHLHAPAVSVREQAEILAHRLRDATGAVSFRALVADADTTLVVVARFLALLEMYRDQVVAFDQVAPLGELTVHWRSPDTAWTAEELTEEYDTDDGGENERDD
ncbi:segregation/condensation protein A [Tersicoccus phoenicis]|uniref:Segregation and condensation protein A n=1 Tax=Tersicoccus phoenicis TaxID=554083 RepID=A0A1R1L7E1_9MICC|nr:ScpA family protein [Tersicoccus phoenicis]OMH23461.1 segregation/condensation protein A [Tersicoccus phoenicis]